MVEERAIPYIFDFYWNDYISDGDHLCYQKCGPRCWGDIDNWYVCVHQHTYDDRGDRFLLDCDIRPVRGKQ